MADNPLQVGHYRLLKTLGIGAFGKVKLGKHVVTDHLVAIKILNRNRIKQLDMGEKVGGICGWGFWFFGFVGGGRRASVYSFVY